MIITDFSESKKSRLVKIFFFIILFAGVFLRFYQYLMGRSLWEDETHLALNVMKCSYAGLLKPLDYIQGAPVGFLWIVKTITLIFGSSELALRALPFIASLLTLPLFFYAVQALTKSNVTALLAFLVYSLNIALIFFSSEFKPYAVDVSCYVLMLYLALSRNNFVTRRRTGLLIVAGGISIMISLSAFVILFCIGCNMALKWYYAKKIGKQDLVILASWLAVFAFNYFYFIHNHPSTEQQRINYASGFCPTDFLSCEFITFLNTAIGELFFTHILKISKTFGFAWCLVLIFFVAIRELFLRKRYNILLYTCLPVLIHLALSAFKFYPFVYRLILYLTPAFIILMAYGTYLIAYFMYRKIHAVLGLAVILFCSYSFCIQSLKEFPEHYREIKPALDFVNTKLPNAHVYIMDPVHAYMYYYERGYAKNKIYKAVPWEIDPPDFYQMISNERTNYVLFYSSFYRWGYGDVIEDLRKKNLIVQDFTYNGYAVSEVKPENPDTAGLVKVLDYVDFPQEVVFSEENYIAMWSNGSVANIPVFLPKGSYRVSIVSKGSPAGGVYPHLNFFANGVKLGDFFTTAVYERTTYSFEQKADGNIVFTTSMDNDAVINKEDRNAFINFIEIRTH